MYELDILYYKHQNFYTGEKQTNNKKKQILRMLINQF